MSEANRATAAPPEVLDGAVRLRAIKIDDWALECELSRDPDVVMWTYYPSDMDEDQSRRRIAESRARADAGLIQRYVILDQAGHALGTCGIGKLRTDVPEIFYALLPTARGRGAATEATALLSTWALAHGYSKVALETVEGNTASEHVARRAGFAPVDRYEDEHRGEQVLLTRWLNRATGAPTSTK